MKIQDIHEHLSCYSYDNSEHPVVELVKVDKGESEEMVFTSNKILFLLEGVMQVEFGATPQIVVTRGDFMFTSIGMPLRYEAIKNSMVMLMTINGSLRLCRGFDIENLYIGKKKSQFKTQALVSATPLRMNELLWHFIADLNMALTHKLMCKQFFELKIQEFFILLRAFYTKEQLRYFFSSILSPNTVFSEFVKANWLECNTVYNLADAMNLSVQHFTKKFKIIFGMPPGEWLIQEKARCILGNLQEDKKTFQQIASDYGFGATSNFNRFCKKQFGETPNTIRKKSGEVEG